MPTFRPTVAPPGRLVRLGVVLDLRNQPGRLREIARMCDRARVDALWVRDALVARDGAPRLEAWTALTLASVDTKRARLGAMLGSAFRPPAVVAAMAGALDLACDGRLDLGLSGRLPPGHDAFGLPAGPELERYATTVCALLRGERVGDAQLGRGGAQPDGPPLSVEVGGDDEAEVAARVADNLVITATPEGRLDGAVAAARAVAVAAGRDAATLGVAVQVPVSVGRTTAEAFARAEAEPLFRHLGHPAEVGIFGTLERCHDRVAELAHAGVTELRCVLPNTPDVQDVIAQLTAVAVGSVEVFTPGAPRSRAPEPPVGWGGRPRFTGRG
jgi:alkanesulfonate monooxygenase SsuD/methylene tetrahydromethanopterin reductase-like flavin-dependent oxidoreductase (luciferase family)